MVRPISTVLFDITNRCNLNCIFCQRKKFVPEFMTPKTFRHIVGTLAPKVSNFLLSCAWEYSSIYRGYYNLLVAILFRSFRTLG